MVTEKQKRAITFCEEILDVKFDGNIENYNQVSNFLSKHLDNAKARHQMIIDEAGSSIPNIY